MKTKREREKERSEKENGKAGGWWQELDVNVVEHVDQARYHATLK